MQVGERENEQTEHDLFYEKTYCHLNSVKIIRLLQ